MNDDDKSIDLIGLGKLAKAIPESVYKKTTDTTLKTFEKIIAPITETTSGLGRYIKQKFDNMVEIERSILEYSLEKAKKKLERKGLKSISVSSPRSTVRIVEELSKETDFLLNEMWTNLLCSEITSGKSHPFFINVLSSLSKEEAILLQDLKSFNEIGEFKNNILMLPRSIRYYILEDGGAEREWNMPSALLLEYGCFDRSHAPAWERTLDAPASLLIEQAYGQKPLCDPGAGQAPFPDLHGRRVASGLHPPGCGADPP